MLGKSVTDLQSNITVGSNAITGSLKYVEGYTGFSSKTEEQSGHYLAFHSESNGADSIVVQHGEGKPVTLDSDGIIILWITDVNNNVKVTAYKDGAVANMRTFDLTGLTLE